MIKIKHMLLVILVLILISSHLVQQYLPQFYSKFDLIILKNYKSLPKCAKKNIYKIYEENECKWI